MIYLTVIITMSYDKDKINLIVRYFVIGPQTGPPSCSLFS